MSALVAWPGTRPSWPGRSAARCRGRPRRRPAAAPRSTAGWSSGSASSALIDPDDLLGAADDGRGDSGDGDGRTWPSCSEPFEAGEWAGRWPAEVEVPFETLIGDRLVRGRIDAVFADAPAAASTSWTGRPAGRPQSAAEQQAVAVQLAAYRLAWAALAGVPREPGPGRVLLRAARPHGAPRRPARRRRARPR